MNFNTAVHKKTFLLFLSVCAFFAEVNAGEKVSLNIKQLHSDPISGIVRKTFDEYLKNDPVKGIKEIHFEKSYIRLFSEKFIVLGIEEGGFGGYFVTILVSQKKMNMLRLWIYSTDKDEYQIREIKWFSLSKDEMRQFDPLRSEKYRQYWL